MTGTIQTIPTDSGLMARLLRRGANVCTTTSKLIPGEAESGLAPDQAKGLEGKKTYIYATRCKPPAHGVVVFLFVNGKKILAWCLQ